MYSLQSLQPRSRFRLNYRAFLVAIVLFGIELGIATVLSHIGWLRGFVGDVLAVVLVYYALKALYAHPRCGWLLLRCWWAMGWSCRSTYRTCMAGISATQYCAPSWAPRRTGGTCWPTPWALAWC
jgi:hypothetical protein